MSVIEKEIKVGRPDGIHARPASELIRRMKRYQSTIELQYAEKKVDAKSVLQLMTLAVKQGSVVTAVINGTDAEEALFELEQFLQGNN